MRDINFIGGFHVKNKFGPNEKSAIVLSDDALHEIAAGFDQNSADFLATNLYDGLISEKGGLALEEGYSREEVEGALKAAFRGLKLK